MGQGVRPWSKNIWQPIFWRIISVSLSVVWSGGVMWHGSLLFFLLSEWVWVRRNSILPTVFFFLQRKADFIYSGFPSVLVLLMVENHWKRTSLSTVFLISLSLCQNEMLTVCSALSSLSFSLSDSELLIACDCWHCWADPHYSTANKI